MKIQDFVIGIPLAGLSGAFINIVTDYILDKQYGENKYVDPFFYYNDDEKISNEELEKKRKQYEMINKKKEKIRFIVKILIGVVLIIAGLTIQTPSIRIALILTGMFFILSQVISNWRDIEKPIKILIIGIAIISLGAFSIYGPNNIIPFINKIEK